VFRRLRDALERALAAATPPPDLSEIASRMREAVIEQKAGLRAIRGALEQTERQLQAERLELATAERRRGQAEAIGDAETVQIADRYIAKHRERAEVLEKKVAAQREEAALAERDLAEMTAQLQEAARRAPAAGQASAAQAWHRLGAAGMDRPETDLEGDLLKSRLTQAEREAAADAKLEAMKKKMGK
jgi:hypothetical protein